MDAMCIHAHEHFWAQQDKLTVQPPRLDQPLVQGKFDAGTSQWRGRVSSVSYRAGAALRRLGLCMCL